MSIINDFFEYLIVVMLIINSCLYAWSCRTLKSSAALNYFTVYIIAICIVQFAATVLAMYEKNNLYLSHFILSFNLYVFLFFSKHYSPRLRKKS